MKRIIYCLLLFSATQCRERYDVPLNQPETGFLVVEGFINSSGPTSIQLSRTSKISERNIVPETGALVGVVGEDNSLYPLTDQGSGVYSSEPLALNNAVRYRLYIKTTQNKEYYSDFSPVRVTPPIDDITWIYNNDGIAIYVNSHDPQNNTHYYKWSYEETWEFQSAYHSNLILVVTPGNGPTDPPTVNLSYYDNLGQTTNESIYTCWKSQNSSTINIGSTLKLNQDIVYMPIVSYPKGAWPFSKEYSIKVKQTALSKEGFEFHGKVKKNSESVGSIFDAQPSEIKGNISCISDPSEQVIGFVEVTSEQEKRVFVKNSDLPGWNYRTDCPPDTLRVPNSPEKLVQLYYTQYLPTVPAVVTPTGGISTLRVAPASCVDCTLRGSNNKPSFWP